jgi:hypothetical protein
MDASVAGEGVTSVKLAATSRQVADVVEQIDAQACPSLKAAALLVDAVLAPDPSWQVKG